MSIIEIFKMSECLKRWSFFASDAIQLRIEQRRETQRCSDIIMNGSEDHFTVFIADLHPSSSFRRG
jgi:hypothetical protein